ncbi:hypothetical protein [Paraburkholderia sediminicola]|uniref:hypothetical protein n=1 Tax=Paraburkholderia sediminicola TaxID=458836 RepID=UPI0038BA659B
MKIIPVQAGPVVTNIDSSTTPSIMPSEPPPADALLVTCDGTNYTVYEPGDELPATS